jgi:Fe-S oxidoreductase
VATITHPLNGKEPLKGKKIGLFIPCYIDLVYPEVGIATLELLEKFGLDVGFPLDQTCCGQPMSNNGDGSYSRMGRIAQAGLSNQRTHVDSP